MDAGNNEAKLAGQVLAQGAHPGQQLSALIGIDQGDQGIADFEREIIERQQRVERIGLNGSGLVGAGGSGLGSRFGLGGGGQFSAAATPCHSTPTIKQEGELGHSGNHAHGEHGAPAIQSMRGWANSCWPRSPPSDLLEEARVTTRPPAMETSSEGIMVTRPSPTVRTV